MTTLNNKTKISIGLVITFMGALFYLGSYQGAYGSKTDSNTTALQNLTAVIQDMNTRLSRLEGEVHKLNDN